MLAVVHEVRGHDDLLLHHVRESEHGTVGVALHDLVDDALVRNLVPPLVGGDEAADGGELLVAVLLGEPRRVPVRDLRRPLLERRVHEPQVRIVLRLRVHPGADEVLNRRLDRLHVHLAGEVEVLVHEVSVAVLLRGPHPRPLPPRGRVRARLILRPFQRVEHVHVRRKRLLGDHVADEDDEVVVREGARAL